jgi:hypothetical protein
MTVFEIFSVTTVNQSFYGSGVSLAADPGKL